MNRFMGYREGRYRTDEEERTGFGNTCANAADRLCIEDAAGTGGGTGTGNTGAGSA